jgi:ribosomal protein L2
MGGRGRADPQRRGQSGGRTARNRGRGHGQKVRLMTVADPADAAEEASEVSIII